MSIRLTRIAGSTLVVLLASLTGAEAQFAQRGFGGAGGLQFKSPMAQELAPKPKSRRPATVVTGQIKRAIVVATGQAGAGKKPPRREQASNDNPPKRPGNRPDRPPKIGDSKPPKRPPIVVVVPPVITDPPDRRPDPPPKTGDRKPPKRPPVVADPPPPRRPVLPPRIASPPLPPLRLLPPAAPLSPPPPLMPPPSIAQPEFVADEVLITVSTAALPQLEADVAQAFNVAVVERIALPLIDARLVRLRIPDGRDVPAVAAAISTDPRVALAQPNYLYRQSNEPTSSPTAQPTAAPAAVQIAPAVAVPGLQYALAKLGAEQAHRLAQGRGAKVAVIDSGVDQTHPDLATAEIEHFDATSEDTASGSASELDTHGTGIAGIIAARGTVQGIAPASQLVSARVFRKAAGGAGASATTVRVLKGITWSVEKGARVLNMSFAGPRDPLVERHVKVATSRGLVSVAAAGNNGLDAAPAFPAAYEDVIAVTAIDANDRLYEKANRGSYVALAAPGVDVIVPATGRTHHFQSGTSFAAAHVSGVVALLLEVNPALAPADLREILAVASEDLGTPGRDPEFGAGRINATKAVELARK